MTKLIIDTDPGVDDSQAIAFAITHPDIDLIGLTTVFGNADVELTTRNALAVLRQFGRSDIPVAQGAGQPLVITKRAAPDFVHGNDGIGNLDLPIPLSKPIDESAVEFILRSANEHAGELVIVAIGPLTNIAKALEQDPSLPSKLKQLIVMGGAVHVPGNVSPVAEANFANDPHAADKVCSADWPLSIIGLDVTMQIALRDSHFSNLRDNAGKIGEFLWQSSRFYVDFYTQSGALDVGEPACAMHDASALVYLSNPELFQTHSFVARVAATGVAEGQLICAAPNEQYFLTHWEDLPTLNAALHVDSQAVLSTFMNTLLEYPHG